MGNILVIKHANQNHTRHYNVIANAYDHVVNDVHAISALEVVTFDIDESCESTSDK